MRQKIKTIRVDLDPHTDLEIDSWSRTDGRSKRRHVAIVLRKLAILHKTEPAELERLLRLADRQLSAA